MAAAADLRAAGGDASVSLSGPADFGVLGGVLRGRALGGGSVPGRLVLHPFAPGGRAGAGHRQPRPQSRGKDLLLV